jgi:hypothetical protein
MPIARDLGYYHSSIGSRIFVLTKTRPKAEKLGNKRLVGKIDLGLKAYRIAATMRLKYVMQRDTDRTARNGAVRVDADLDATLGDLFEFFELHANRRRESAQKTAAQAIVKHLFPSGVFPITSSQYDEQHSLITTLIKALKRDHAKELDILHARDLLDDLDAVNTKFGEALDILGRDTVSYADTQAQRTLADEEFKKVTLIIHADYCDDDATRADLLKAIEAQDARTGRYFKRRGVAPEIDPDTGEIIEDADVEPIVDETEEPVLAEADEPISE